MARASFYHPQLSDGDTSAMLSAEESAHAAKSRRLKQGDAIRLMNGRGLVAQASVAILDKRALGVTIHETNFVAKSSVEIVIACALPKGDRQRTMVDMLSQLGVHKIVPLDCEYSVTRGSQKALTKWQRYAIEACKQSQNPWIPEIAAQTFCSDLIRDWEPDQGDYCYADAQGERLVEQGFTGNNVLVLIGPEGGFSVAEINAFRAAGVKPVKLAEHILRTETAAVAAATRLSI